MDAVTGAAGKAVGSLGIGELTKSLGGLTSGATDAVQKGVSGATDSIKKTLKVPRELSKICLVTSTQIIS